MKIDKIEITIAARCCTDFGEYDDETEAYLESYTEAVAEAVGNYFPGCTIECELDWHAPESRVKVESNEFDAIEVNGIRKTKLGEHTVKDLEREVAAMKEIESVEEAVREIWNDLWNNSEKWWRRNSEFHPNA